VIQRQGREPLLFFVEPSMGERSDSVLRRACLLLAWAAGSACAAGTNGPMSSTPQAAAASAPAAASQSGAEFDVGKLFANTCGWCHSNAGRVAGKGPQLMGTALTDEQIAYRIKHGKSGAMPAFGSSFSDEQIKAIIKYIRDLKPEGAGE
jgi:mono/diheme cytochrome c family protein